MLKRIPLIFLAILLSINTLMAQDLDMGTILEMMNDQDTLLTTDISALSDLLNDSTVVTNDDGTTTTKGAELMATITEQIDSLKTNEESTALADKALAVVDAIKADTDGNVTLQEALDSAGTDLDEIEDSLVNAMATMAVEELFSDPETEQNLRDGLQTLDGVLGTLTKFGQANAQTSSAATLFAHQGYKLFALSLGFTGSFASSESTYDTIMDIQDSEDSEKALEDALKAGGFEAGVSFQALSAQVGINLGFLVDGLYAGVVLGSTNAEINSQEFDVKLFNSTVYSTDLGGDGVDDYNLNGSVHTSVFGITANYQLVKPKSIPILFRWNGLSVGSGVINNAFSVDLEADFSKALEDMANDGVTDETQKMTIDSGTYVGSFSISSNAVTIPLEISTGVRLLSTINLGLGLGADLKFGSSKVKFNLENTNEESSFNTKLVTSIIDKIFEEEGMSFPYSNPQSVDLINFKAMIALGVGLGPVTMDFNTVFYSSALNDDIGMSFGMNFILRI